MPRLTRIVDRQRTSRTRDLVFAALVALTTIVSLSSVSVAAHAASPTRPAR